MKKFLAIDFEFNRVEEPRVHPVCVSFQEVEVGFGEYNKIGPVEEFWLDRMVEGEKLLPYIEPARARIKEFVMDRDIPILCHSAASEFRALHAMMLGLVGEQEIKALDTYVMQRQLTHTYPPCKWGRKLKDKGLIHTTPPRFIIGEEEAIKDGLPHDTIGSGYAEAVAHHLGVVIDTDHKTIMRNKIIAAPPFWTKNDREFVQAYCTSDIEYLPALAAAQLLRLKEAFNIPDGEEFIMEAMINHGRYMSCIADREDIGTPIHTDAFYNLCNNSEGAVETMIQDLVQNHAEFFVRGKKTKGSIKQQWVKKQGKFNDFLMTKGLYEDWEKSPKSDMPKTDEKTLKTYDYVPEIYAYRQVVKTKQNLGFFQADHRGAMLSRIGTDGRVRSFPWPFGTQTGRDAPTPSTGFILNMAKWLRWLVQAPEGYSILGCDWVSQEFIIAAALSGDQTMIDVYNSGDVYMGFGARAGLVPANATKKTHGIERQTICKPVILGQQFGLGAKNMAISLSASQGRYVSTEEAKELVDLHKELFAVYWAWKQKVYEEYCEYGNLILPDGWALLAGQDSKLSIQNFPVQGMGGILTRKANWIARGRTRDLKIFAGHHDAMYGLVPSDKAQDLAHVMEDSMAEAVGIYLPDVTIRTDMKILSAGQGILEEDDKRVMDMFKKMKKYFEPMETEEDCIRRILDEVNILPKIPLDLVL